MKKIIFLLLMINSSIGLPAQTKKLQLIVKAGINNARYNLPSKYSNDQRIIYQGTVQSFQAGAMVIIPLSKEISFQPGLLINGKGGKTQISRPYYLWEESTSNPVYLELPLNLICRAWLTKRLSFFAGGGPYIAAGIGGKNKYEGDNGDIISNPYAGNQQIKFGKQTSDVRGVYNELNKVDYGLNLLGGLRYNKFQLYVNYGQGLKDVKPAPGEDMGQNHVWSYGLAYAFHL